MGPHLISWRIVDLKETYRFLSDWAPITFVPKFTAFANHGAVNLADKFGTFEI